MRPITADSRPVVLVFSDGADSSSLLSSDEVPEAARWSARSSGHFRELFVEVLNQLRARYLVTYSPEGVSREGWHDVRVSVKKTKGIVTARPGYLRASMVGTS